MRSREPVRVALQVRDAGAGLLGDDASRRPVPRAQPALEVAVEPPRGKPTQIERSRTGPPDVADPRQDPPDDLTLLAASFSVVSEPSGDESCLESGRGPDLQRRTVQGGALAALGQEQLFADRVVHHPELSLERDRDGPAREAVEEVGRAVE